MSFLKDRFAGFIGPEQKLGPLVRLFRANFRPYARRYAFALSMMVIAALATAGSAYIIKDIINKIFIDKDGALVFVIAGAIVFIYLVKGFATYFSSVTLTKIGNSMVARLQRQLYDAVLRQDIVFFQRHALGDIMVRISQNASAARAAIDLIVLSLGRDLFTLVSLVAVMVVQNPIMSGLSLLIAPPAIYGITHLLKKVRTAARKEVVTSAQIVTIVQESVQGIRVVKSFGLEDRLRAAFNVATGNVETLSNRIATLGARSSPLMETLGGLAIAFVVMFGGYQIVHYNADPGAFFSFITALLMAYEPAKRLARFNLDLEKALVGVRMMYEVLDEVPELQSAPDAVEAKFDSAAVTFDRVDFAYGEAPVLKGLSLTAPENSVVALVGPSGAGKSTVFSLVERFYDPTGGAVLVNGTDIRRFTVESLRRHVALVTQDTFLFDGSVAANIADGRPDASRAEIEAAARDANAYDFIMAMPDGFDSRVGEGGGNLSGGQRQRIAIARAILRQAPILLLDEATSALDAQAERDIQEALGRLMKGRTTFVIAHRLATVRDADIIYVMDKGEVVQKGNHEQLMAEGGLYAHLRALQFKDEKPDAVAAG
ncbi:ABC transporter transmembrane domain-containing protein [Pleomorphomonas sp. JP5]|uniref:ABC transporter ATP-binding protein n=1 Tax=Pleomorphomonas sp. JP5 TaxID=2942998 RepID=UPI002044178A|nr:ABC transporter transmembrane domain-containing protein [Pleomorphomonas sp. JP5]MCM5557666.1 ABC transporter ATP-binding protein/permease [Pleomorphomonas sp. JP5]